MLAIWGLEIKILKYFCNFCFFQSSCNAEVRLSNVRFRYPTRRKVRVLRNISIHVQQGHTVALVGTSGCGKSTSVSLVERFYDAKSGSVVSQFS